MRLIAELASGQTKEVEITARQRWYLLSRASSAIAENDDDLLNEVDDEVEAMVGEPIRRDTIGNWSCPD